MDGGLCVIVEVAGPFAGHATIASSLEGGPREKSLSPKNTVLLSPVPSRTEATFS